MNELETLRLWILDQTEHEELIHREAMKKGDQKTADEADVAIWAYGEVIGKIRRMQNERGTG